MKITSVFETKAKDEAQEKNAMMKLSFVGTCNRRSRVFYYFYFEIGRPRKLARQGPKCPHHHLWCNRWIISLSVRTINAFALIDGVAQFKRDRTRRIVKSTILFSYAARSVDSRFFFDMCMTSHHSVFFASLSAIAIFYEISGTWSPKFSYPIFQQSASKKRSKGVTSARNFDLKIWRKLMVRDIVRTLLNSAFQRYACPFLGADIRGVFRNGVSTSNLSTQKRW